MTDEANVNVNAQRSMLNSETFELTLDVGR